MLSTYSHSESAFVSLSATHLRCSPFRSNSPFHACPRVSHFRMCEPLTASVDTRHNGTVPDTSHSMTYHQPQPLHHSIFPKQKSKDALKTDEVFLPQHATLAQKKVRLNQLAHQRNQYRWSYNSVADAPLIESLPQTEKPNRRWVVMMKRVEDRCQKNSEAIKLRRKADDNPASDYGGKSTRKYSHDNRFQDYKDQFLTIGLSPMAQKNTFLQDRIFGWYRVAGPNPMELRGLTFFRLCKLFPDMTDVLFRQVPHFESDSLETAAAEHRIFAVDYSFLHDVHTGTFSDGSPKSGMYLYSPRVLLAVPRKQCAENPLLPIAIHCSAELENIMHTAVTSHTRSDIWQAAKLTVQVADAYVHETVHHFGRTHLLMEAIICASYRAFAPSHPLLRLMRAHFEGTAFINDTSLRALICPGGTIDRITAPSIDVTQRMAADGLLESFSFNKCMPDIEFAARGVDGPSAPHLKYPYRDDALALWKVILEFMDGYVSCFYLSDRDVITDHELQMWGREMVNKGHIKSFGEDTEGGLFTRGYLSRALAMVIFTASVQHAAVNFPQATHMQFAPAMPLAGYGAAPGGVEKEEENIEDDAMMRMLPGLRQAEEQLCAAEMLGVVRYTRLGEYGSLLSFGGQGVQRAVSRFQRRLRVLDGVVEVRNKVEMGAELPVYSYLSPKNIPQSVNV